MSDSLSSLFKKEQPWAIRSLRSLKKSNREPIALIALYKRVTRANHSVTKSLVRDLLVFWEQITLLLSKNERFAGKNSLFSPFFWQFFTVFSILCPRVNRSCCPLLLRFFIEWQEQFAQGRSLRRATVHPWANCSWKTVTCYFALSLTINNQFTCKTKEQISNPAPHKIL